MILVTGGYDLSSLASVEVLRADGSAWCRLPDLPLARDGHTQAGLLACGGKGYFRDHQTQNITPALTSCVAWSPGAGAWLPGQQLLRPRFSHSSWATATPPGLLLLGGEGSPNTTELLRDNTGNSSLGFPLRYDTRYQDSILSLNDCNQYLG